MARQYDCQGRKGETMSTDKLPALPPRPQARKVLYNGMMFDYHQAKSHMDAQDTSIAELEREIRELKAERDTPETEDFFKGVPLEAAHQRGRWGNEHDSGKEPQDWFWLVGYLAGKCLASHIAGDRNKALHHTISTAAALANWHMAIKGKGDMRPGIETPIEERNAERKNGQ